MRYLTYFGLLCSLLRPSIGLAIAKKSTVLYTIEEAFTLEKLQSLFVSIKKSILEATVEIKLIFNNIKPADGYLIATSLCEDSQIENFLPR